MTDETITVRALKSTNSTTVSVQVGAPINKTYTSTMSGGRGVITIPEVDMVVAMRVPVVINVDDGGDTDSASFTKNFMGAGTASAGYIPPALTTLKVAPNIYGFGSATTAGRGGQFIVVTTLASTGAGSLDEALSTPGTRTIVFNVSGDIYSPITGFDIAEGSVSVYGQTAPGQGICLRASDDVLKPSRSLLRLRASDVLFQYIRFRCDAHSTANGSRDSVQIGDPNNGQVVGHAVFDHCTISWGPDENLEVGSGAQYVTISNCLIYHGLGRTAANGADTGYTNKAIMLANGAHHLSLHHNVVVSAHTRAPLFQGVSYVDWYQNIVAGTFGHQSGVQGFNPVDGTATPLEMWINIEGNLHLDYRPNPTVNGVADDGSYRKNISITDISVLNPVLANGTVYKLYIDGNMLQLGTTGALQAARVVDNAGSEFESQATPFSCDRPPAIPVDQLEAALLPHVGASVSRDSYDTAVILEVTNRLGTQPPDAVIDPNGHGAGAPHPSGSYNDNGANSVTAPVLSSGSSKLGTAATGYIPQSWIDANNMTGGANDDDNGDGYTNIEDYVFYLTAV